MRAIIKVIGMVQGVGFRYFIYRHATRLGLKGYVRNNFDGSVEIVIEGEKDLINILIDEAKIGPRSANVNEVIIKWEESKNEFNDFTIEGW